MEKDSNIKTASLFLKDSSRMASAMARDCSRSTTLPKKYRSISGNSLMESNMVKASNMMKTGLATQANGRKVRKMALAD